MSQPDEAWNDVGEQFKRLGSTLKRRYQTSDGRGNSDGLEAPSEDEVKDALRTLSESIKHAFVTVGDAMNDAEIREETRQTAGSFFDALGATFAKLGEDICAGDVSDRRETVPDSEISSTSTPSDSAEDQE
jgi:hypothetical protein